LVKILYGDSLKGKGKKMTPRYKDFDEWFKLNLGNLWSIRDRPMTNELLKSLLADAFNDARVEMKTHYSEIEQYKTTCVGCNCNKPTPPASQSIPCSVTAPASITGWPQPTGKLTL
jgi:hypothetical protein